MWVKVPAAAASIVCSACIAASVTAPVVALPEKSNKVEASQSVTRPISLAASTSTLAADPVTDILTLLGLPLQVVYNIQTIAVNPYLITPLGTLAVSPLTIPFQLASGVPIDTIIQNTFTTPVDKLTQFPTVFADTVSDQVTLVIDTLESIFGGTSMATLGTAKADLAAAPAITAADPLTNLLTLLGLPLQVAYNIQTIALNPYLITPLGTLAVSPLTIPFQLASGVPIDTIIQNTFTTPIDKLTDFPSVFASTVSDQIDLVVQTLQDIFGGGTMLAANKETTFKAADSAAPKIAAADPLTDLVTVLSLPLQNIYNIQTKAINPNLINPLGTLAVSPLTVPFQLASGVPVDTIIQNTFTTPINQLTQFPTVFSTQVQAEIAHDIEVLQGIFGTQKVAASKALTAGPTTLALKSKSDEGSVGDIPGSAKLQTKPATPKVVNLKLHAKDAVASDADADKADKSVSESGKKSFRSHPYVGKHRAKTSDSESPASDGTKSESKSDK